MIGLLKQRLLWRFLALGVLTLCLSILSRSTVSFPLASTKTAGPSQVQNRPPRVSKQMQPDAPLVISLPRIISWDGQNLEVAIDLVNVSRKPIRAYAIGRTIEGEEAHSGQVMFTSLDLTNSSALEPNRLTNIFDVYQARSAKEDHVVFFVDYVEFLDGTKWGTDSANSAQRSAGQRAAARLLSKRLLTILNAGSPRDVMTAIEKGEANIEPPTGRSEEWKEGFRLGCASISQRLKLLQNRRGASSVDSELRQLAQRFQGEN